MCTTKFLRRVLPLWTEPAMWQPRGPGTACRLVSRRHHLGPRSAPAQDTTFHHKLSRQLSLHMTNRFRPLPRMPSFRLTLLGVLAGILTLRHLSQLIFWWMNERTNERANERTSERASERTSERANERTSERASERANERINQSINQSMSLWRL